MVWLKGKTLLRGVKPKPNRVFQSQRKKRKKKKKGEKKRRTNERRKLELAHLDFSMCWHTALKVWMVMSFL